MGGHNSSCLTEVEDLVGDIGSFAVVLLNEDRNILFANSAFIKIHEIDQKDLKGVGISTYYSDSDPNKSQLLSLYAVFDKKGYYDKTEIEHVTSSGRPFVMMQAEHRLSIADANIIWLGVGISSYKDLEVRLQQRYNELKLLSIAQEPINNTETIDDIFEVTLLKLRRAYGAIAASIWLVDEEKNKIVCEGASSPQKDKVVGEALDIGRGIVGASVADQKSILVPDALKDKRHYSQIADKMHLDVRSIISVPLIRNKKVLGAIQVVDRKPDNFSCEDVRLIEKVASSASIAVENFLLKKKLRENGVYIE
jgi:transcriptional regulator with GAF, ATPase, and Fis domain